MIDDAKIKMHIIFIAMKITCTFLQVFAMLQYYFSILFQNICLNGDKNYVEIWYNNY